MSAEPSFAFLGPEGTYCDEAMRTFATQLGIENPTALPCASFDEIFDCVDRGKVTYGVVAKENALEGPVTATLDNFAFRSNSVILGEEVIDIHHCLLLHPDATIEDVKTVASHPQGLGQCRRYIARYLPGRETLISSSTAESARIAANNKSIAGIANAFAGRVHGAKVYAEEIEDHFGNQTSFALIGRPGSAAQLAGKTRKTTLAMFLQADRAGALNMILNELAYAGINLSMIQSRPTKQQLGDYMFFMEFEGDVNDLNVQTALNCLRMKLREVKVLGSYPVL